VSGRSDTFSTRGARPVALHALHWGDPARRKLVLLHGGGANAHWWDHLAPRLAKTRHVIGLDFRGHGDSEHPDELLVGAFNDDLESLLDHLGEHEVSLVGHSMGAHVALDHAARDPRVRSLALLDLARGVSGRWRRAARLALTLRRTYATREEAIERYRFLPDAVHAEEQLRRTIASHSVRREDDGRYGFKFDPRWFGVQARPRPDASKVSCPTLLVRGSESSMLTPDGARDLVQELPESRLVEVEGAGHHVQIDQPSRVLAALSAFLDETELVRT